MRYETKGKRNIDLGYNIPKNKTLKITDDVGGNPQFMLLGGRKIHLTGGLPEYIDVEVVDNPSIEPSEAMMNVAKAFDLSGLGEELTSVIKKQQAIKQAFSEILFFKSEIDQKLAEYELLINGQVEDIRNEQSQNKVDTDGAILTLSNGQSVNTKDIQNIYGLIGGLNEKSLEIDSIISDIETILKNHEHGITKESLGLGKVDNTSDEDKPVSKATQEALDSKVSVDEFNEIAEQLKKIQKKQKDFQRGIDSLGGMGIGTANLEGGKKGQVLVKKSNQNGDFEWRDSTTKIDDELSLTSEYPVQNKVITSSIIIKSNTIPTATQALVGSEYQYTGETNQTYTHGYIYECVEKTNYTPRISFDPSKIGFDYDKDLIGFFAEATPNYEQIKSGVFEYLEGGDIWSISAKDENGDIIFSEYKLYTDDLRDAGFVFLFPSYEDEEKIDYEFALNPSSSYEWERVDVQPDSSRWGKIKGNLPDQEDLQGALDEKQGTIQDLETIRSGATLGATSLQPSDVIDNISSTATNKPLSANMGKSLQDQVDNLKARGRFLALWDSTTGLAQSNPPESPYTYKTGDYFIVGNVGSTNYKPDGASYTTGVASSVVETAEVSVDDVYYYDGSDWRLQQNTQKTLSFVNIAGSPYDNTNLASALNDKQNELTDGTGIDITNDTISVDFNDVATAAQGAKADSAVQPSDLGTAAYASTTDFATSAQGAKADTAVQPAELTNYLPISGGNITGDLSIKTALHVGDNLINIPDEYTLYDYVQTNNQAYFDTGYRGNNNSEYEIEFEYLSMSVSGSVFPAILGDRTTSSAQIALSPADRVNGSGNSNNRWASLAKSWSKANGIAAGYTYHAIMNKTALTVTSDDDPSISIFTLDFNNSTTFTTGNNITIGYINSTSFKSNIKIKNVMIIRENGVELRRYYPVKRNADNVFGLYDVVNNTFITNAGSGSITGGTEKDRQYVISASDSNGIVFSEDGSVELKNSPSSNDKSNKIATTKIVQENLDVKYDRTGGNVLGDVYFDNNGYFKYDYTSTPTLPSGSLCEYTEVQYGVTPMYAMYNLSQPISADSTIYIKSSVEYGKVGYIITSGSIGGLNITKTGDQLADWNSGTVTQSVSYIYPGYTNVNSSEISATPNPVKIYEIFIVNSSGVVTHHWLPWNNGSDGRNGFYDVINNAGAYVYTSGPTYKFGPNVTGTREASLGTMNDLDFHIVSANQKRMTFGKDGSVKLTTSPSSGATGTEVVTAEWVLNKGYINGITSAMVTTALGYTPYNSTNPAGYITGISSSDVITALGYSPVNPSSLATVATSGSYNDLSNKPTIPAAQVNSDWNANSGVAQILNKPTLATVATTGAYSDLSGKPTIPTVNNPTITITQGGVTKGSFTLNQSTGDTIALDAGGGSVNTFNLFDHKWSDYQLNDQSWLRADTFSWQDGTVYSNAYNHLVDDYNSGEVKYYGWKAQSAIPTPLDPIFTLSETPSVGDGVYFDGPISTKELVGDVTSFDGVNLVSGGVTYQRDSSVDDRNQTETVGSYTITYVLATDGHKITTDETNVANIYNESGVAWYYILDTANQRFKLPRTKYGFTGLRDTVGNYVSESLPNITGTVDWNNGGQGHTELGTATGVFDKVANTTKTYPDSSSGTTSAARGFTFDASRSSSAYQDNAPVQQRATQMYLYFYVGQFSQSATEQTAGLNSELFNGKMDRDMSNMNASQIAKETIVGWGMPDYDTVINIGLTADGSTYTAPKDGVVILTAATNNYCTYELNGQYVQIPAYSWNGRLVFPVSKGTVIKKIGGTALGTTNSYNAFIPAKGE